MTKFEELEAARDAAEAAAVAAEADCYAAWDAYAAAVAAYYDADYAYEAELKKTQEENPMAKLEELKITLDAACDAAETTWAAVGALNADTAAAADDAYAAYDAYQDELKKTQNLK
jgi:GTP cyclohydrolase FolE2